MKIVITHPFMTSVTNNDEIPIKINDLDNVENASCTHVHLADCMDYIPFEERFKLLTMAYNKLRNGGELTLSCTDMVAVGHFIYHKIADIKQLNTVLFSGRLSCDSVYSILEFIRTHLVANVDNVKNDGVYVSIKIKRPSQYEYDM